MRKSMQTLVWLLKITLGCAVFALGFNLFLAPNHLNAGGVTGLAMLFVELTGVGTVGVVTAVMNLPLFVVAGLKIGKKFFFGSLLGMGINSLFLDLFARIPVPQLEPLVAVLYGGVFAGLGLGLIFASGASTGGSDLIVRLLKLKFQHIPIGTISAGFDIAVAILTGILYRDVTTTLYIGITVFLCGKVIDAVVYSFDYSKVAMIISPAYERIAREIDAQLDRGATYLNGEGSYNRTPTKVIVTAVKKHQIADLKRLVVEIDPDAFIIVQEAHQVLGDGFSHYSKDSL